MERLYIRLSGTFWCVYELYSRSDLLREAREGVTIVAQAESPSTASARVDIDNSWVRYTKLEAVVREILRLKAFNISGRVIMKDTTIEGGYMLRKDAVLLVPSAGLHENPDIWGKPTTD
jgi:cytochrome P450